MGKYECEVCGYVYDPEIGDPDNKGKDVVAREYCNIHGLWKNR